MWYFVTRNEWCCIIYDHMWVMTCCHGQKAEWLLFWKLGRSQNERLDVWNNIILKADYKQQLFLISETETLCCQNSNYLYTDGTFFVLLFTHIPGVNRNLHLQNTESQPLLVTEECHATRTEHGSAWSISWPLSVCRLLLIRCWKWHL